MKILITGATGFLGGNLARHFALQGHEVQVLVRNPLAPMPAFSEMSVKVFQGDLLDVESLRAPMKGMDWVIHCGALVYVGLKNREQIFNINVQGTKNLCQVMLEEGRSNMIHVSTVDTLGMKSFEIPADEDTKQTKETPKSSYGESKLEAEAVIDEYIAQGLHCPVVLPCFMLGAWDVKPSSGQMILEIAKGFARFPPSGGNNFVHVRDVCIGIERAMEKGVSGRRYILGNQNLSYMDAFTLIAEQTSAPKPLLALPNWIVGIAIVGMNLFYSLSKKESLINGVAAKLGMAPHYFDSSRAIEELGLPQTPIEEAIRDSWDWFQENNYV